jgi:hypothetical protein
MDVTLRFARPSSPTTFRDGMFRRGKRSGLTVENEKPFMVSGVWLRIVSMDTGTTTPIWVTVLTPILALAGAAFGSAVLLWNNAKSIKVENITKERAKWRDNVRQKALDVQKAAVSKNAVWLDELHLEFSLVLNPTDPEDRSILVTIRQLKSNPDEPTLSEFADRISLLLKHDWERAKWEAKGGDSPFSSDLDLPAEPPRKRYADFKRDQSSPKTRSQ